MVLLTWISTCTATSYFYVLPVNTTYTSCPYQPCATLSHYLKNKTVLSSISDVEFRFLPGEHQVTSNMEMWHVVNFSLVGLSVDKSLSVAIICKSQSFVAFLYSYNISVSNIIFRQCDGNIKHLLFKDIWLLDQHEQDIIVSLFLFECYFCKVTNSKFFGYGLMGINLVGNSLLDNVTIKLETTKPAFENNICMYRIMLIYIARDNHHDSDVITMNKIFISGYSNNCHSTNSYPVIHIQLAQNQYNMMIILSDSQFYDMDQTVLKFDTVHNNNNNTALIKNCIFKNLKYNSAFHYEPITAQVPCINTTIHFVDCDFLVNENIIHMISVTILDNGIDGYCVFPTNITLENCNFLHNVGALLNLGSYEFKATRCIPNVYLKGYLHIHNNSVKVDELIHTDLIVFHNRAVYMNGNITISDNLAPKNIILFQYCNVTFATNITFLLNTCTQVITLEVWFSNTYINVMEYTNIVFADNICTSELISLNQLYENQKNLYPFCLFQYETTDKRNTNILPDHYSINFMDNVLYHNQDHGQDVTYREGILEFLTHCKWLPTAVFYGSHAGTINQQVISIDNQQWHYSKKICHCPQNGYNNCSIDLLGPVYPGQMLQLQLCIPQAKEKYIVYVETYAESLPTSACRIANQAELVHSMSNSSKTITLTIVSDSYKECELFLTAQPDLYSFYDVFIVQLLPCPVGFTFYNGICDCDPILLNDIEICYIDYSAIKRPANTWITARGQANNTEYLISDCPMDYCLPYSSNVNLLHPDMQCQFNRTGILCSQCQHHLSMVFGSSKCMECTDLNISIIAIVMVAGVALVVSLYLLNLTVTIGNINGIIFYANIVSINDSVFLENDNVFIPLRMFISFLSLDLGIETCFYHGMDSYTKVWLQLFLPFYLMIIAASVIIASYFSTRILRLTLNKSVPVLATLFLLSYTGVLRTVSIMLFSYSTIIHLPSGNQQVVWSIDASVPLFSLKFTILFITCILLFLLLVLFNITLPLSRVLLQLKIKRGFKSLLRAFNSSYKNKSSFWITIHIITRNLFLAFYLVELNLQLIISCAVLILLIAYQGYTHPYKGKLVNIQELILLTNLTIMYAVSYLDNTDIFTVVVNIMISLAFIQFCTIVLYHFLTYTKCKTATRVLRVIKGKVIKHFIQKKSDHIYDYNYDAFQDTEFVH